MRKLNTLEEMVRRILKEHPITRDDDRELTLAVYMYIFGINPWSPIIEVFRNKDLPSQESLGRVRRKIQETELDLRGSKEKEKIRMNAQADYIEYSLSDRL